MKKDLVIWGGTGNFKVLCELLSDTYRIIGYFDNDPKVNETYNGIPCLGGEGKLPAWVALRHGVETCAIVSIGHGNGAARSMIHELLVGLGLEAITAVHRTAFVASNALVGEGSQVYAMAAICAEARIGRCCIVNTGASVDHESVLEDGVTVGPGAVIAGSVHVERNADIYSGAVILPRIRIGEGAVVGAGAIARHDVDPWTVVVGNPARVLRKRDA